MNFDHKPLYNTRSKIFSALEQLVISLSLVFFLFVSSFFVIDSDTFLETKTMTVFTDGQVVAVEDPAWTGITLDYYAELVTIDGKVCTTGRLIRSYEDLDVAHTYQLEQSLLPCLEEGALHTITRQYGFFRPTQFTTTVVSYEDISQRLRGTTSLGSWRGSEIGTKWTYWKEER